MPPDDRFWLHAAGRRPHTHHLINTAAFANMKRGAIASTTLANLGAFAEMGKPMYQVST